MNKTALVPLHRAHRRLAEEAAWPRTSSAFAAHPLDQFRAFQRMRRRAGPEEEIAAAFFVSASVVKQRLKLAAVAGRAFSTSYAGRK